MKKKGIDKDLILLLITTLVTVVVWVGFEVYRAYTQVVIPTGLEKHLQPLSPTLRTEVFGKLEQRSQ
jgi:hypothetical protein